MRSANFIATLMLAFTMMWFSQAFAAEEKAADQKTEESKTAPAKNPVAEIKTSEGVIKVELWKDKAPVTVKNFISYAREGFYNGTIFHRVIDNFMIQGGGFTPDMNQKQTHPAIKNEANADLKNETGTIAMARLSMPLDSATSQFFINVRDNESLDHRDETPPGFGYAVFGKVIEGMDVVNKIKKVPTANAGMHQNVPVKPVIIEKVTVTE